MLRTTLFYRKKAASSSSSLFTFDRAIQIAPGQLFSKDLIVPSSSSRYLDQDDQERRRSSLPPARRWMRDPNETCVEEIRKSPSMLTSYEVSYKFADPHWNPLLSLTCGNPVSLEVRARHINYSLRHLVQKGHAMYVVRYTDHSVLHPRGLAAISQVVCAYDQKQERLLTQIVHEGPLDYERDPEGEWGVVAVSDARSMSQAFQRKGMLWQRSRRVGAIQAQMGTFDWTLHNPNSVGRDSEEEVMLLRNETNFFGNGLTSRAIVSSVHVAKHPFHYVHEFEAPPACAVDAFHQAMYMSAKYHKLVSSYSSSSSSSSITKTNKTQQKEQEEEEEENGKEQQQKLLGGGKERLHCIAWRTRQYFPYLPIELDLPFEISCGPPMVYRGKEDMKLIPPPVTGNPFLKPKTQEQQEQVGNTGKEREEEKNEKQEEEEEDDENPFTLIQFDVAMKQGASEYLYDQGNSSKAPKWWSQKNALPYECTFWCVRDGLVDFDNICEAVEVLPMFERIRPSAATQAMRRKRNASSNQSTIFDSSKSKSLVALRKQEEKQLQQENDQEQDPYKEISKMSKKQHVKESKNPRSLSFLMADEKTEVEEKSSKNILQALKESAKLRRNKEQEGGDDDSSSTNPWDIPSVKALERKKKSAKNLERIAKEQSKQLAQTQRLAKKEQELKKEEKNKKSKKRN